MRVYMCEDHANTHIRTHTHTRYLGLHAEQPQCALNDAASQTREHFQPLGVDRAVVGMGKWVM
jgi:hypothetical protein